MSVSKGVGVREVFSEYTPKLYLQQKSTMLNERVTIYSILITSVALILLTQRKELTLCQTRDDYTADRKYYKVNLTLTEIPANIPAEAREVRLSWNNITTIEVNIFS